MYSRPSSVWHRASVYTSSSAKRPGLPEGSLLSSNIPSRDLLDLLDLPETTLLVVDLPLSPCSSLRV